jgi:hypothetical protein
LFKAKSWAGGAQREDAAFVPNRAGAETRVRSLGEYPEQGERVATLRLGSRLASLRVSQEPVCPRGSYNVGSSRLVEIQSEIPLTHDRLVEGGEK